MGKPSVRKSRFHQSPYLILALEAHSSMCFACVLLQYSRPDLALPTTSFGQMPESGARKREQAYCLESGYALSAPLIDALCPSPILAMGNGGSPDQGFSSWTYALCGGKRRPTSSHSRPKYSETCAPSSTMPASSKRGSGSKTRRIQRYRPSARYWQQWTAVDRFFSCARVTSEHVTQTTHEHE